ncbi:hemophore-related protein [Mycolicibacterium sp. BK556]|uniref:heme-binding protein n=1 Tax=Mycobacteriaceae TaxID=1762 RepID=UPI00105EE368|nr:MULTISPECIES: heme-binding protein [Mycobacteriaceae]MBB3604859.1 hemophore-related protein [Mycolicibacterium sp. BK556]MBB3634428.1 hemophore-related protein [Mycolicibacterium sp. BK607]MBB3752005.1 hemophore-related protein [Mycolicibacterium sp. BK634]TDO17749.1 hemophore-related protein [Mycobacterium sp. BK086]
MTFRGRAFGALVIGALGVGAAVAMPAAAAAPCTASGLSTTASGVLADAGGYLATHPGADDVLTAAASQPADEARNSVRSYFAGHLGELNDLQNIARPLRDLRNQCGIAISPGQLALLFDQVS